MVSLPIGPYEYVDAKDAEIARLHAERDSALKEFKGTLEANAGLRAEIARLEAETDSLRTAVDDLRALNAQLSANAAAKLMEMRDRAEKAEASIARLRESLTEIGREQSAVSATVAADKFQSIARAALAPRPPEERT